MKSFPAAVFLALAWLSNAQALAAEALKIAAEDDAEPWSFSDGSGFANEVVLAAFKAAGLAVELEVVPYARCKEMVVEGKTPACFSMSWVPEFSKTVAFSEKPLFSCDSDYFYGLSRPVEAKSGKQIPQGTTVGIVAGYEYPPSLYALKKEGVISVEEAETEELNLKKLAAGRIDLALINWNDIKHANAMMAKAGVQGKVKKAFTCGKLKSYIGFSKRHPKGALARRKFVQGYRRIAKNGELKRIEEKWKRPIS